MKKTVCKLAGALLVASAVVIAASGCGAGSGESINVLNWGEYIEDSLIDSFEEETGIKVNYTTASTCEEMYAKLKSGGVSYDIVVPSDYMVSRMIEEDMLETVDFSNVPNVSYIDDEFLNPDYDPSGEYSVPYQWGTVAVIYNSDIVDPEDTGSWDLLWNEKYEGQILMFDNSRDAIGIALKRLGYSYNTADEAAVQAAADLLIEQKPLVQAYVMDQIFDKMENGEAAIAPYYTGDYYLMLGETDSSETHLDYYIPEEGSNLFVDAMCIPKGAQNKSGAEAFINFICEPENMALNTEYISYSTAESAARELLPDDMKNNEAMYPPEESRAAFETYVNLPETVRAMYDSLWVEIMSS